jgi:pyrroline-5-carboxylate reductase
MTYELGIIGAGNMAEAIVRGVLKAGLLRPSQIIAADVAAARRELFEKQLGARAVEANSVAARDAGNLLLSVKPQHAAAALAGIGSVIDPARTRVISIMAGIGTPFIEKHLGGGRPWRVVRTMPNTPMLVGEGMAAICGGAHARPDDVAEARKLFEVAATVIDVSEDKMDAVTAMSGSGPAYFFYLVEQMIRAGESLGLTAEQSRTLAIRTAAGAAKMLGTSSETPQELRRKVTSPAGTTQAAITHLEQHRAGELIVEAITAAAKRSRELGV